MVGSTASSWLDRLRGQDHEAWNRLAYLYGPLVFAWCRRAGLPVEDAEDVVQEVFQAVWKGLGLFRRDRPEDTFRGWLCTITQNKVRDRFRRQHGEPRAKGGSEAQQQLAQLAAVQEIADSVSAATSQDSGGPFRRAMELIRVEFEERTWQAFWRVTIDGHYPSDVAADLGITVNAVYKAKARVLRRLRDEFGDLMQ